MAYVLPVPALASSTVMPVGQRAVDGERSGVAGAISSPARAPAAAPTAAAPGARTGVGLLLGPARRRLRRAPAARRAARRASARRRRAACSRVGVLAVDPGIASVAGRPLAARPPRAGPRRRGSASAHAAAVRQGSGSGSRMPAVVEVDQPRQLGSARRAARAAGSAPSGGIRTTRMRSPRPRPTVTRRPAALGIGGGGRQQPDPRGQPLLGLQPGERRLQEHRAAHRQRARRRAGARPSSGTWTSSGAGGAPPRLGPRHAGDLAGDRQLRADHRHGELARAAAVRARARPGRPRCSSGAGEQRVEQPLADAPALERVELDRQRVEISSRGSLSRTPSRAERNARAGCDDERDQVLERDHVARRPAAAARRGTPAGRGAARCGARAPAYAVRSKLNGRAGRAARVEVPAVERLQRMADEHLRPAPGAPPAVRAVASMASSSSPTGTAGGRGQVRALVGAGEGDDQPLPGGQQRVEQQLAVLAARIALADQRPGEQQVVAVARRLARERPVVEPEQADDPVGHRAHRVHRADGEVAGAEVRPGRAAGEPLAEQRAELGPA